MNRQRSVEYYRPFIKVMLDLIEEIFRPIRKLATSENDTFVGEFLATSLISTVRHLADLLT